MTTDYDENGKKISEKTYAKQNGQDIIYRKKFKDGIVMQEGAYVRLAGQLVEWTPDVSKILAEYDRRFTNTNNNQEKETQKSNENRTTNNQVVASIKRFVAR